MPRKARRRKPPPAFGFNDAPWDYTDQSVAMAAGAGASVARVPVDPRVIAEHGYGAYDDIVAKLRAQGLKPLLAISSNAPPELGPVWKQQVRDIASRYQGAQFEIWNEPNHDIGGNIDVNTYARLIKQGERAVHSVSKKAEVISGGLAPTDTSMDYYRTLAKKLGKRDVTIGAHFYPQGDDPLAGLKRQYKELRKIAGDRGVYVSELGVSSNLVSEDQQAKVSADMYRYLAKRGAEGVVFHSLSPEDDTPGSTPHPYSGWLEGLAATREDGSPKPVYDALRQARQESLRRQDPKRPRARRARR